MMMRLDQIFGIVTLLGLFSCDSRKDELDQFNDAPYFAIGSDAVSSVSDSIKLSQGDFLITPKILDVNNNLSSIQFVSPNESGMLKVNGQEVIDGFLDISENSSINIAYNPSNEGLHQFVVRVFDSFDFSAELDVSLVAFSNIAPTLVVKIVDSNIGGPFEKVIDASGSFDGDKRFGGRIIEYEYTFLNVKRNIKEATQTVIFPSAGNYQVQVRVKDNDNVWTDLKALRIQIN